MVNTVPLRLSPNLLILISREDCRLDGNNHFPADDREGSLNIFERRTPVQVEQPIDVNERSALSPGQLSLTDAIGHQHLI